MTHIIPIEDLKTSPRKGLANAYKRLCEVLELLSPYGVGGPTEAPEDGIPLKDCTDFVTLRVAWMKAMEWNVGMEHGLTCMLATAASTASVGDQLWMKIIGPPGCGKSSLCEALSTNKIYVNAKSTLRGLHSGYKSEGGEDDEDHSLLADLRGKTFITKDGDTLLQAPNKEQILSEARDIYDGASRTHYRNGQGRDYEGLRLTWLLCGTSSLREIDSSELGERFLDCVMMDKIDANMEDMVLEKVARKAAENLSILSDGSPETRYDPDLLLAMQLTGGYVTWLRENAQQAMEDIKFNRDALFQCTRYGKFIAHMRARPSSIQDESSEREFAARLVSQLVRLAKCLAFVYNEKSVSSKIMSKVRQVTLDTSRGHTLEIVRWLYFTSDGMSVRQLALSLSKDEYPTKTFLKFLKQIKVVEDFDTPRHRGIQGTRHWRLTEAFAIIYHETTGEEQ